VLQAHDSAVRALSWSNSGQWLISTDNTGLIKYFQPNMNNLQIFQGHNEAIRDVSWAPNDERFCTGGDDGVIKIWNFERMKEEKVLTGKAPSLPMYRIRRNLLICVSYSC
jgi:polyadenylation factor subunit 2